MTGRGGAGLAAGSTLCLLVAGPGPASAAHQLVQTPTAGADPLAPLLSLVTLAAWVLAGWLLVVLVAAQATRLPGVPGRLAAMTLPRLAPFAVRRLLAPALGLTIGLSVVGAVPAAAGQRPPVPAASPSLDWPIPAPASSAAPHLEAPLAVTPASSAAPHLEALLAALGGPAPRLRNRAGETTAVVVQPGDSLWAIAAKHLPAGASDAQVAQAWPQWWSANRAAVGADPDLIHPGLLLTPPASR